MEANSSVDTPPLKMQSSVDSAGHSRPLKGILVICGSIVFLMSLVALIISQSQSSLESSPLSNISIKECPRGIAQGVSPKSYPSLFLKDSYNWTEAMFSWQRTAFHFQPQNNWMNGKLSVV